VDEREEPAASRRGRQQDTLDEGEQTTGNRRRSVQHATAGLAVDRTRRLTDLLLLALLVPQKLSLRFLGYRIGGRLWKLSPSRSPVEKGC